MVEREGGATGTPMTPELLLARQHICLALDVDTLAEALSLTELLAPFVGTVKVGLELYLAEGAAAVRALREYPVEIFLDLKLHDIPTTVEHAAAVVAALGARYLTVHTLGGAEMLRACVDGLARGASSAAVTPPIAVGVTVLTSDAEAPLSELSRRAALAKSSGCGAIVCAAPDLATTCLAAPGLLTVVPGTRPAGAALDDQRRVMTPAMAIESGADLLVLGRPITRAADPVMATIAILRSIADRG